jgi:hypothetical protein
MKRSRFTDQQIAFALQQAEQGTKVAEVTRKMGISEQTFYRWKKKFGGLMPSEGRRPMTCRHRDLWDKSSLPWEFLFLRCAGTKSSICGYQSPQIVPPKSE